MGTKSRIEIIDYLKGFSILTIVLYHLICLNMKSTPYLLKLASNFGSSGVLIFFFCSGFGLYLSYLNKPTKYIDFLYSKAIKIYIPYVFIVFITAIFPFAYKESDKFIAILSHVFFFKMFIDRFESSFGSHLWFMSTLFQFYFAFFILIKLKQKTNKLNFIIICTLISVMWVMFVAITGNYNSTVYIRCFLKYLFAVAFGIVIAEKYHDNTLSYKMNPIVLLFVSVFCIGIAGISGLSSFGRLLNDIPAFIGYGTLVILIYQLKLKKFNKIILIINTFSFEWYLTHALIFDLFFRLSNGTIYYDIVIGLVSFMISILVGYLYHLMMMKLLYQINIAVLNIRIKYKTMRLNKTHIKIDS